MKTPWHSLENKTVWVAGGAGYLGSVITLELDVQAEKVICLDIAGRPEAFVSEHGLSHTVGRTLDVSDVDGAPGRLTP